MHNAFMSYNQKARFGTPTTPGWMPPSIADEMMQQQRQGQQQQQYQQSMPSPSLPVPTMAPMQMMLPMPMPYGYPIPTPGPSNSKHRSSRHGHSRQSSREHRSAHRSSRKYSKRGRSRHRRRDSTSEESSSSEDEKNRRHKGKQRQRSRARHRRSPSTSSSSSSTSDSSRTISRRTRSSSSGSGSGDDSSSSDNESSTASGRSSGRETTLTANERVQASQSAANALAASAERVRQRTLALSDSIPGPDVAPPTGNDLFKEIQKAYLHYPQKDPEPKGTRSRSPPPISEISTSGPSSKYLNINADGETDIRTQRTLPRPKLASLAESQGRRALYPVGASADSVFSRVGYQPVRSPKLPIKLHVQPSSHSLPTTTPRSSYEEDPLVVSKSHPNSAVNSPSQALFPPLEYEPLSRMPSTSHPQPPKHSRQLSTFSNRHATLAPSQIQAAIQHRSVSEAAFRLDDDGTRIARPAQAALSAIGSKYSAMPSAYAAAERREIQDGVFDKAALGPNFRGSYKLEHADRSDPRHYVPMQNHPYLMQDASKAHPAHPRQDWDGQDGDSSLCCR